jgi:K+-transporting ATPase ATPase C chain
VGKFLKTQLWPAVAILLAFTVITGIIYPAAVTAAAQVVFPGQANGSMISVNGTAVGSSLIGQTWDNPKYFSGRPSAAGAGYDATISGGTNLSSTNQKLIDSITAAVDAQRKANNNQPVPIELVTSSASGLDPDISPAAARFQVHRVAQARSMTDAQIQALVDKHTSQPFLWFTGEPSVRVLELNLDLDGLLR